MTPRQRYAFKHPCPLEELTADPAYGWAIGAYSVRLTLNNGWE